MRALIREFQVLVKGAILFTLSFVAAGATAQDDISGVVKSADGVEAGVWVIAETTDLKT